MNYRTVILVLLFALVLINVISTAYGFLYPTSNYSDTYLGKLSRDFYQTRWRYAPSIAYILLVVYFTWFFWKKYKKHNARWLLVLLGIIVLAAPAYPVIDLVNIYLDVVAENPPFISDVQSEFPRSKEIEKNWLEIKREFDAYYAEHAADIECLGKRSPGLTIEVRSDPSSCWKTLFLRKIGKNEEYLKKYFPTTMRLIDDGQIKNAMFSILDKEMELTPHYGYYRGYLRYHIGIDVPEGKAAGPAHLICGGERYEWKEGEGVLFDDMYLHSVKNPTDKKRVVLFIDVMRKNLSSFSQSIVRLTDNYIEGHPVIKMVIDAQHQQKSV